MGPIGSAVLTFIGYKQTDRQTNKQTDGQAKFIYRFILKGEFTIFCGLSDCLALLENFHYSESDISYIRTVLPPTVEEEFFIFLKQLNPSEVQVYALPEGKNSFPDYI